MEKSERLAFHSEQALVRVEVKVTGAQVDTQLLKELLMPVSRAASVDSLHQGILESLKSLSLLETYKRCSVTINPGDGENTAVVDYHFRLYRWWSLMAAMTSNREGGGIQLSLNLRNLRKRADLTRSTLEYKPNTGTWGFAWQHTDPLLVPGRWGLLVDFHSRGRQLDSSLKTWEMGQFLVLSNHTKTSSFKLGREVRTNYFSPQSVLSEALLTHEKYYFSYFYRSDTRNSPLYPSAGSLLEFRAELSTVNSCLQSAVDISGKTYKRLVKDAVLEIGVGWQGLKALGKPESHTNDRLRGSFVKGFQAYGSPSASSLLSAEAKLSFHNSPFLHLFSLTPFLYANVLATTSLRGSCGLGVDWITHFGHVEISYAVGVAAQAGDRPAQVQILLSE